MKKPILFLLYFFCYFLALGQSSDALTKGKAAKARMMQAFGGEEAVQQLRHFSYTLIRTTAAGEESRTVYTLDLAKHHISTRTQTAAGPVVKTIDSEGAWQSINGHREPLTHQDKQALERTFFFNFIPMLQNEQLQFTYLCSQKYNNRPVDIVRVSDPNYKAHMLDLFIEQENGQVLTSSREDESGQYPYFADELEYVPVGEGIVFPLVYKILVNEKVTSEGVFQDIVVRK